ncbi:AraC family transcriptional regulator [Spirosoma utsteinense]|uniref:AraC-like DNA-binding protein n=1 Tax=Spirosoma utsteinense TaxID=2585773 RepID=A0ABR6WGK9_9BACT|nr:AraC family transcriptional regulator [Spirosoma utsteinense]MBC3789271.1 AraC-like DNA-binding protein [Spirosoma utsteinense]MBC3795205.1 AraC-like DNA-binding protein [Spirosoma utsteinense]
MPTKRQNRKGRGFTGERMIEIPKEVVEKCRSMPLINTLFITQMGFFPKARYHYYQRPNGMSQVILLYCTDGMGWIQVPHGRVTIQAGSVFAIAPGVPHSYGADTDNPWTIYWFHLSGNQCAAVTIATKNEKEAAPQAVRVGFSDERIQLFNQIVDIFLNGYSQSNLLAANLTLSYLLASFILPDNFQKEVVPAATANPTNRAISYMQSNLSKTVTLDNIAQSANLSSSFFSRKFKQDTGYAPIEYFNHLRIQKACQLLHFSDLRINEVASQLGIDDPFYFSRLFKKQMGISPVEYRKSEGINRKL